MSQLKVTNLCKSYPTPGEPLRVLEDVSFSLAMGESMSIVGPSGSGKSTLLHILGTLDAPTSGTVTYGEEAVDPFSLDKVALARFRNEHVGYVFQEHYLLPQLSVLENTLVPCLAFGAVTDQARGRAMALLNEVGLLDRLSHRPAELSGGERQRAAIARALLMQPSIVLADEPTGNLDQETAAKIIALLHQVAGREGGSSLVVVTHNLEVAATCKHQRKMANRALV